MTDPVSSKSIIFSEESEPKDILNELTIRLDASTTACAEHTRYVVSGASHVPYNFELKVGNSISTDDPAFVMLSTSFRDHQMLVVSNDSLLEIIRNLFVVSHNLGGGISNTLTRIEQHNMRMMALSSNFEGEDEKENLISFKSSESAFMRELLTTAPRPESFLDVKTLTSANTLSLMFKLGKELEPLEAMLTKDDTELVLTLLSFARTYSFNNAASFHAEKLFEHIAGEVFPDIVF